MTAKAALEAAYRDHARRVRATLIRLLGGFDVAEDAVHEAFAAAAEQWPRQGVPDNPYAWLVSAGRFKIIDRWRREARLAAALPALAARRDDAVELAAPDRVVDDELRLIFTCCHPALAPDARIALTLREVGGLTTEEIARAYLVPTPTIAQRIVRAKAKLRDDDVAYEVPAGAELAARLDCVLHVLYLIFNEGYAATAGPRLVRAELGDEAIRLARLVCGLLAGPDEPEALGLLALMLLHDARRIARVDAAGELILLEDQDRARWDRPRIAEALALIDRAFAGRRVGPYVLQAAIAGVHAAAPSYAATDWSRIIALYDVLVRVEPSPVVALNRAAAVGLGRGPAAGLAALDELRGLDDYHLAHAARADFLRRLGQVDAAVTAYERALALTRQPAEQRFLRARLAQLGAPDCS